MTALEAPPSPEAASIYLPEPAEIVSMAKLTELEMHYTLRLGHGPDSAQSPGTRPLGHQPGQFVQVSLLGVGECPISICSSPTAGPG